jgi:hypothetical protein
MTSIASKEWWGPRIWRILHILAEFSDHANCIRLWRNFLHTTADVLPCSLCKGHFHEHARHIRIPLPPVIIPPTDFRNMIRRHLWQIHQGIRGDSSVSEEDLVTLYGGDRIGRLQEAQDLVKEINVSFTQGRVLDRFHSGVLIVWVKSAIQLINVLRSPPPPPPPVQPSRNRVAAPKIIRPVAQTRSSIPVRQPLSQVLAARKGRR